ncbi:MAG: hypothetical protein KGL77_02350 [Actinomycetales bacterium]|nr:hypothetical protein [Actinomycetales bacterium]
MKRILGIVLAATFALTSVPAHAASATINYKGLVSATISKSVKLPPSGCSNIKFTYKYSADLLGSDWLVSFLLSKSSTQAIVAAYHQSFSHFDADPALRGTSSLRVCRNSWTTKDGTYARASNGQYTFMALVRSYNPDTYQFEYQGVTNKVTLSISG